MGLTINIHYTGEGDAARGFVEEMEASGPANVIRAEKATLPTAHVHTAGRRRLGGQESR